VLQNTEYKQRKFYQDESKKSSRDIVSDTLRSLHHHSPCHHHNSLLVHHKTCHCEVDTEHQRNGLVVKHHTQLGKRSEQADVGADHDLHSPDAQKASLEHVANGSSIKNKT
jgi:hypothetical protein